MAFYTIPIDQRRGGRICSEGHKTTAMGTKIVLCRQWDFVQRKCVYREGERQVNEKISILTTELLSYLMTKVEYYSNETYFKVKNLQFMNRNPYALGRICGILNKEGIILKVNRRHTPSVWRTNLMTKEGL